MRKFITILLAFALVSCSQSTKNGELEEYTYNEPEAVVVGSPTPPRPESDASMEEEYYWEESGEGDYAIIGGGAVSRRSIEREVAAPEATRPIAVDDVLSQLIEASLALTAPATSNISEDVPVKLLVSLEQTQAELIEELEAREGAQVVSSDVQVSKTMSATISAPDFEITTVSPTRQAITTIGSTEWLWTLRPKSPGGHNINITVIAHVMVDGERVERHIKTFEETLTVEITAQQRIISFIEKYWQWMMSTLLIPLAIAGWKVFKNRKKPVALNE